MRRTIALALMLLAALPAQAGVRATYVSPEERTPLIVEVADNGDARIGEANAADYGLLIGGQFYMVGNDGNGRTVARLTDIARAVDTTIGPVFGDAFARTAAPAPRTPLKSQAKGSRTVGGRQGTVYAVAGLDRAKPDETIEIVVSRDADLRSVGRALENLMNAALIPNAPMLGAGAGELVERGRALSALGTPLAVSGQFELEKVETLPIAADRVALPATPTTYEALVAKMRAAGK